MTKVLTYKGYSILKSSITDEEISQIKKDLSVSPYIPRDYRIGDPDPFYLYLESPTKIYCPKFYAISKYGIPDSDKLQEGKAIDIDFKGSLRDEQIDVVNTFIEATDDASKRGGILNLYCGFGKTTISIYLITKLKKKTIIIVHKDFLLKQWKERISEFAPNARIGTIKAKVIDIKDKDIVIASLQSVSMKDYDENIFKDFGFLVVDECFPYRQKIATENGPMEIGILYKKWKNNEKLPKILSYNEIEKTIEYKNITYAWEKQSEDLLKISYAKSNLKCTYNHKILTIDGYKEAKQLKVGELLLCNIDDKNNIGTIEISLIENIKNEDIHVYDIEVEDNHNFICASVSNIGPIVHNCHHIAAETFSKALQKINCKFSLGLSATIKRKDGLSKVFMWYIGDIVYSVKKRKDTVEVELVPFSDSSPEYSQEQLMFQGKLNVSRMINNICNFLPRSHFIINKIKECLEKEPQRRILILSDRRNHLHTLKELLDEEGFKSNGYYFGGMKNDELKESEDKQIILGTFQMASEGFDVQGLDTLFLVSPKTDVIQSVGRILREKPEKRKHTPKIYDIVDQFSIFFGQARKRQAYYKSCKYDFNGDKDNKDNSDIEDTPKKIQFAPDSDSES